MKKKSVATDEHDNQDMPISVANEVQNLVHTPLLFSNSSRSPIKHCQIIVERLKQYHPRPYYCFSFQIGLLLAVLGGLIAAIIVLQSLLDKLHQQAATTLASHQARYASLLYTPEQPHQPCHLIAAFDTWSFFCLPKGTTIEGWYERCFAELSATCNDNKHYSRLIGWTRTGEACLTLFGIAALVLLGLAVGNIYRAYQNNKLPLTERLSGQDVGIIHKSALLLNIPIDDSMTCQDVRQLFQQKAAELAADNQVANESSSPSCLNI